MLVLPEKKTRTIQLRAELGDDIHCDATLYWAMYSDQQARRASKSASGVMFPPNAEKRRSCQASSQKPPAAGPAGWGLMAERLIELRGIRTTKMQRLQALSTAKLCIATCWSRISRNEPRTWSQGYGAPLDHASGLLSLAYIALRYACDTLAKMSTTHPSRGGSVLCLC
jgi:hypothetical protein